MVFDLRSACVARRRLSSTCLYSDLGGDSTGIFDWNGCYAAPKASHVPMKARYFSCAGCCARLLRRACWLIDPSRIHVAGASVHARCIMHGRGYSCGCLRLVRTSASSSHADAPRVPHRLSCLRFVQPYVYISAGL